VKDFKERRPGKPIGDALDDGFDNIRAVRARFVDTLRSKLGASFVEFTPSPSADTVSGIVAFTVGSGDEQLYERAKRRLEHLGILVDILTRGRETGIRVCLPPDVDLSEIEGVARSIADALQ